MEKWESLVHQYPSVVDQRTFTRTLEILEHVVKEDLAPFETEWLVHTLLNEPVNLFRLISINRADEAWHKPIRNAFKHLSELMSKFGDAMEPHYVDIVEVCKLSFDKETRNEALACLTRVARRSAAGAGGAAQYVDELARTTTNKSKLALLVGTLCEYHPVEMEEHAEIIFRIYLSNNLIGDNSPTVKCSVLQALMGMFKHFELPQEVRGLFYNKLTTECLDKPKCEEVVLQILSRFGAQFAAELRADARLRRALWGSLAGALAAAAADALHSIYRAIFHMPDLTTSAVQTIIDEEVAPRLSASGRARHTALRVLSLARRRGVTWPAHVAADMHVLEFELRRGELTRDVADDVAWQLECNIEDSEKLLQTAIMFFTNVPASKRKEVIVYNLLAAPADIRKSCVIFLTTESCQDAASLESFQPLWTLILDSNGGEDSKILEGSRLIFEDFMEYLAMMLEMFLEEEYECVPESLCLAAQLCAHVVCAAGEGVADAARASCARVLAALLPLCEARGERAAHALLRAGRALAQHAPDTLQAAFYQCVEVDACVEEEELCAACAALVAAPAGRGRVADLLKAVHTSLCGRDAEARVLCGALHKLDALLANHRDELDRAVLTQTLRQVERLHTRRGANSKEDRILSREVFMFLGKGENIRNELTSSEVVDIQEPLVLNLQNPSDGNTYSIDLRETLQLAAAEEDPDALRSILAVLCADKSWMAEVVWWAETRDARGLRACAALAAAAPHRALEHVVRCAAWERRARARRVLCGGLARALATHDDLLDAAIERALALTQSTDYMSKRTGVDLIESLLGTLDDNNDLSQRFLPEILTSTASMFDVISVATFDAASKAFFDKIALFDENTLNKLRADLMEAITGDGRKVSNINEKRIYKLTVNKVLDVLNRLGMTEADFVGVSVKRLYVAAQASRLGVKSLGEKLVYEMLTRKVDVDDWFQVEVFLMYLEEFADYLLADHADRTIQLITDVISNLTPKIIKRVKKSLVSCIKVYTKTSGALKITSSVSSWLSKELLEQITGDLEKAKFNTEYEDFVIALNVCTYIGGGLDDENKEYMKQWPHLLLKMWYKSVEFPTALLEVGIRCLTTAGIKELIVNAQRLDDNARDENVCKFCRAHMGVMFEYLLRKPYVLVERDMCQCSVLLNDVVHWYVQRKCPPEFCDDVLDLVVQLWPIYERQASFTRKVALLQDMQRLPKTLPPESSPMRWAVEQMESGNLSDMLKVMGVLPPGDAYSACYRVVAAQLPTRLRELRGAHTAVFRALLDRVPDAHVADRAQPVQPSLLDIIATLAEGDESEGWWVEALRCCMASAARRGDGAVHARLYSRCWAARSRGVCERLYLPLLRHSTSSFCEQYLPDVVADILKKFDGRQLRPAPGEAYLIQLTDFTVAFSILQLAFDNGETVYHVKTLLSTQTLELSTSRLNRLRGALQPWHVLREVVTLAVKFLKHVACPPGADRLLADTTRAARCAALYCACAALRRRQPAENLYKPLFEPALWDTLVDPDEEHDLPLPTQRVGPTVRQTVAAEELAGGGGAGTAGTLSRSLTRSRLFLRTLSEDPLHFDLHSLSAQGQAAQAAQAVSCSAWVRVRATSVSRTRAYGAASALLRHAAAAPLPARLRDVAAALLQPLHRNSKLVLAQAISDCRTELAPHSSILRAPLFKFVVDTTEDRPFNSVHLDVLTSLSCWRDVDADSVDRGHLASAVLSLVLAIINNRHQQYTCKLLLSCLNDLLEVYGTMVTFEWTLFERYFCDDTDNKYKCCLKILQTLTKNKVYIPGMVQWIIENNNARRLSSLVGMVAHARGCERDAGARAALATLTPGAPPHLDYINTLYYVAKEGHACTTQQFKKIVSLLPKVPVRDKHKCLRIMASFLSGPDSASCPADVFETVNLEEFMQNSDLIENALVVLGSGLRAMRPELRARLVASAAPHCRHARAAVRTAALRALTNEYLAWPSSGGSVVLQSAQEAPRRAVLCALAAAGPALAHHIGDTLSQHMYVRFAESFYLTVYLPWVQEEAETVDVCACATAFLQLLFSNMRSQPAFKTMRLRSEPRPNTTDAELSGHTSANAQHGALSGVSTYATDTNAPAVDVQMPVDDVLASLIKFAKACVPAAESVCACVCACAGARAAALLRGALATALAGRRAARSPFTPLVLRVCRALLPHLHAPTDFQEPVASLRKQLMGTESENLVNLLYEDILLRTCGPELFVLGSKEDEVDVVMQDRDNKFSIQDLVSSFGVLSKWDDLTLQQKRRIERGGLPPLWTDHHTFRSRLEEYPANGGGWFDKMVLSYRDTHKMATIRWYRELQRWPRRHFHISAVAEAIQWLYESEQISPYTKFCEIAPEDCMAEWAARLMIRASFMSRELDSPHSVSRSHELSWCTRANEMGLHAQVLLCVSRNHRYLNGEDVLPWFVQKVIAQRALALNRNDTAELAKLLKDTEKYSVQLASGAADVLLHMNLLLLMLRRDLHTVSMADVDAVLEKTRRHCSSADTLCARGKKTVQETLQLAMSCLYEMLEKNDECVDSRMVRAVQLAEELGAGLAGVAAGAGDAALRHALARRPALAALLHAPHTEEECAEEAEWSRRLQLVCDPHHALAYYCTELRRALQAHDSAQWEKTFTLMSEKLFENPYRGSDYKLLDVHKDALYAIRDYGTEAARKFSVLEEVLCKLERPKKQSLRLAQLCGALTARELARSRGLARLLGLPPTARVAGFHQQVSVLADSARRPCVVSARVRGAARRRYLHKLGDRAALDAAVLRVAAALLPAHNTYYVKPLSEDSGLIEFIEDHVRLRALIAEQCGEATLDQLCAARADDELILQQPAAALHAFQQHCQKVPPYALRTAIEKRCISIQDFVNKKNEFLETLAATTLLCWLLGVGDRHLENLLWGARGVVCVDWASALHRAAELPPARLTRNLQALLHASVFESRLQQQLSNLRDNCNIALAVIQYEFRWMGEEFTKKLQYIEGLLRGAYLPHHVTKMVLQERGARHCREHHALLDHVFQDYDSKEHYSVEEQVSCLLRQCTDPRILAVTRSGWEPWI